MRVGGLDCNTPVRPTTPTRVRGGMEKDSELKTGVAAVAYCSRTFLNSIAPSAGHSGDSAAVTVRAVAAAVALFEIAVAMAEVLLLGPAVAEDVVGWTS